MNEFSRTFPKKNEREKNSDLFTFIVGLPLRTAPTGAACSLDTSKRIGKLLNSVLLWPPPRSVRHQPVESNTVSLVDKQSLQVAAASDGRIHFWIESLVALFIQNMK